MPRPRKTEEQLRADLNSARTMLSQARTERDETANALDAVLTVMGGCTCGINKEARRVAAEALGIPSGHHAAAEEIRDAAASEKGAGQKGTDSESKDAAA